VARPKLEVADIFRRHGPAWREANAGHVSLGQLTLRQALRVMSAIENCRTAALGGHVARCENDKCGHTQIAYNSCRNRHCPKCQGAAAREWLAAREAELLPVPYFHAVFSLPAQIADIAYHNKAAIYDILFKASAETLITIAAAVSSLGGFRTPAAVRGKSFVTAGIRKPSQLRPSGREDRAEVDPSIRRGRCAWSCQTQPAAPQLN
jgi:Transposase zinc-binding domain